MAVVPRSQTSAILSTGLSAVTVALNVAGAAADAVPIAKQILNSAAHISAVAEKIQKKREAMYTLVEKADIYATQIDIAVAGRILDDSLQRRLERLYSIFLKIEALVDVKAGGKSHALTRIWQNVVTKPNRAETLIVELDREIQLFELLTGIQLSLAVDNTARIVDDTARAVAADTRYDGQFRVLRDCDIRKGNIIERCETDEGTVVWASARVNGQLMVIRYLDPSSNATRNNAVVAEVAERLHTPYHEYLENVKKVSTIVGSHPQVVQLYGRHVHGPAAVFRAGTYRLEDHVRNMMATKGDVESSSVERIRLAYKILDASFHLEDIHSLMWIGDRVIVDEYGEPCIGLFDDIARADSTQQPVTSVNICVDIFIWFSARWSEETGAAEQVHNSHLHSMITQQLRDGNDTDSLQQVWDVIRREQLLVDYRTSVFPIISGNLSLSHEVIARARHIFQMWAPTPAINFLQSVLLGGATTPSQVRVDISRSGDRDCLFVHAYTYHDRHVQYEHFSIILPAGGPLSAKIAWAAGVPGDFDTWDGSTVVIYQKDSRGDYSEYDTESGGSDVEYSSHDDGEALEDEHGMDDVEECDDSEKEGEDCETAPGG